MNAKIHAVLENGQKIEIKAIADMNAHGTLVCQCGVILKAEDLSKLQNNICESLGMPVLVLPAYVKVIGVIEE